MKDGAVHSAKLKGALEGAARLQYWEQLRKFQPPSKEGGKEGEEEEEEEATKEIEKEEK
ncbi:hypothetical protein NGA_0433400 [Nannochloropsis gaditana CCMP526]|uniref:uncharacterized protein n=1 Tax=Nannochloropsis gaditana (strain CCMP526) TaxID=1093141 RepID=UPI00029F799B|nr:hypothetical protein NGA_0433400 [Nannochloropsis gaditana CCMP526]EKU22578.1 hypothetical protein NGA_0433400 [Nannochloropsis gaditana CCMP526]|eukprot:XP_005853782.1 hypothetical protein NGA_0433400 [Nannochloropsis gaditana CCMP526]